jgi:hypothetical protein
MYGWLTKDTGDCKIYVFAIVGATNVCSFVFTFIILHIMVFVFGMMNYGLKVRLEFLFFVFFFLHLAGRLTRLTR